MPPYSSTGGLPLPAMEQDFQLPAMEQNFTLPAMKQDLPLPAMEEDFQLPLVAVLLGQVLLYGGTEATGADSTCCCTAR